MEVTAFDSAEFDRDSSAVKRAAANGPVIIADHGSPTHVLMTWDDYQRLAGKRKTIIEALAMQGVEDLAFDPPRLSGRPSAAVHD